MANLRGVHTLLTLILMAMVVGIVIQHTHNQWMQKKQEEYDKRVDALIMPPSVTIEVPPGEFTGTPPPPPSE